jgi:sugar O-acyltransferase (sialic acid O-acetyltransferase NeuD family)
VTGPILVFGASGHGKVVADVARAAGHEVIGFVDDDPIRRSAGLWGLPVHSWAECGDRWGGRDRPAVALGIGDNAARQRIHERVVAAGFEVPCLIHPSAVVAPRARLGAGTVVMALVAVNPDADVGVGAILNTGCVVEHDCRVGDFAHLSPGSALGGGVQVGDRSHLGLGAVVLPLVRVGADVRVGAGAVVHREVTDGVTVVGVPARSLGPKGGAAT